MFKDLYFETQEGKLQTLLDLAPNLSYDFSTFDTERDNKSF